MEWKERIKNKAFWVTLIPAVALLVQLVLGIFGIELSNIDGISAQLVDVVNALFAVLAILGVVSNPLTKGLTDKDKKENE